MKKLLALSLLTLALAGGWMSRKHLAFDGGDPVPPHCPMPPCR